MKLKETLAALLKKRRMSAQALATATDIPVSTIKAWLGGNAPRNLDDVRAVARHMGVSFEYLIFGEDPDAGAVLANALLEQVFDGYLKVKVERIVKANK
jgi:transcriptional regulator with XRE-family HTH domain